MEWHQIIETVQQISENEAVNMSFEQRSIAMCVMQIDRLNKRISDLERANVSQSHNVGVGVAGEEEEAVGIVFHNTQAFVRGKGYYPVCSKFGSSVLYSMREDRKLVLLSSSQIASIRK